MPGQVDAAEQAVVSLRPRRQPCVLRREHRLKVLLSALRALAPRLGAGSTATVTGDLISEPSGAHDRRGVRRENLMAPLECRGRKGGAVRLCQDPKSCADSRGGSSVRVGPRLPSGAIELNDGQAATT